MLTVVQLNPTAQARDNSAPVQVSFGIIAWNEAGTIERVLASLLGQSIFQHLANENSAAEIIVAANGCTDGTEEIARGAFERLLKNHAARDAIRWRVESLTVRGKLNAWNEFVHALSARESQVLFLLDADILLANTETVWRMLDTLRATPAADVCVDRPVKTFRERGGALATRISGGAAQATAAAPAQICGQLYCIRATAARNIFLPKDLAACDDGFIKALVCTGSLSHPVKTEKICVAPGAEHFFDAYTSPGDVLKNQKRQIIGQTIVHILVDKHLPSLPAEERRQMAETLRRKDVEDPAWLKRLIASHVASKRFPWQLYPALLTHKWKYLRHLPLRRRVACLPAAAAQFSLSLGASWLAWNFLKRGCTDYWPKPNRGQTPPRPEGRHTVRPEPPPARLKERPL